MMFTNVVMYLLVLVGRWNQKVGKVLTDVYVKNIPFWNYGFICFVGMLINQVVLHFTISLFPLWVANLCAILVAWSWNYLNAVGMLKKYW